MQIFDKLKHLASPLSATLKCRDIGLLEVQQPPPGRVKFQIVL